MAAEIEERVRALEEQLAKLQDQPDAPKPKDNWDKLSALSTLLSGVIIAAIGIWVNDSLTTSQQRAQDAQATATREMEAAHQRAELAQSAQAQALQSSQAQALLEFQKQQAKDAKALELLRINQQGKQADVATQLEQTQFAKDVVLQIRSNPDMRTVLIPLLSRVNRAESIEVDEYYARTTGNPQVLKVSEAELKAAQGSPNAQLSLHASDALFRVTISRRIQAIENALIFKRTTRDYGNLLIRPGILAVSTLNFRGEELQKILSQYCDSPKSRYASSLRPYIDRAAGADMSLANDESFKRALVDAGNDIVMQSIQDDEFDKTYWQPVRAISETLGIKLPLGLAALYDTRVRLGTGIDPIVEKVSEKLGGSPSSGIDEKKWVLELVEARRAYFQEIDAGQPQRLDFEMNRIAFFDSMIGTGNWLLKPPLMANGVEITE